jgi:hypothetical protein
VIWSQLTLVVDMRRNNYEFPPLFKDNTMLGVRSAALACKSDNVRMAKRYQPTGSHEVAASGIGSDITPNAMNILGCADGLRKLVIRV